MKEVPVFIGFAPLGKLARAEWRTGTRASAPLRHLLRGGEVERRAALPGPDIRASNPRGGRVEKSRPQSTTVRPCPRKQGWYCKKHHTAPMKTGLTIPFCPAANTSSPRLYSWATPTLPAPPPMQFAGLL